MPWRGTREPYPVWLSEVMLQQTQVATATPFYQAFLERFPTLPDLADASVDEVLHAWAGLGYYRRARSLHAAARTLVREHAGRVPDDPEAFGALPGVGRYTLGAVLSICFDRPLPVLDGNVARVLSRLEALPAAIKDPRGARALWERATAIMPRHSPGDWNQALMELGATVCTPRAPRCSACPLKRWCRALALDRVDDFPPAPPRREAQSMRRAAVMIVRGGRLLMTRRAGALLEGLWEPPGIDLAERPGTRDGFARALGPLGVTARVRPTGDVLRHVITHRRIEVEVWRGDLEGPLRRSSRRRWVDPHDPDVAITALARKLGRLIEPEPAA